MSCFYTHGHGRVWVVAANTKLFCNVSICVQYEQECVFLLSDLHDTYIVFMHKGCEGFSLFNFFFLGGGDYFL